jgi:hypothetical protein
VRQSSKTRSGQPGLARSAGLSRASGRLRLMAQTSMLSVGARMAQYVQLLMTSDALSSSGTRAQLMMQPFKSISDTAAT